MYRLLTDVPSFDDIAGANGELERLAPVARRVKLVTVL